MTHKNVPFAVQSQLRKTVAVEAFKDIAVQVVVNNFKAKEEIS